MQRPWQKVNRDLSRHPPPISEKNCNLESLSALSIYLYCCRATPGPGGLVNFIKLLRRKMNLLFCPGLLIIPVKTRSKKSLLHWNGWVEGVSRLQASVSSEKSQQRHVSKHQARGLRGRGRLEPVIFTLGSYVNRWSSLSQHQPRPATMSMCKSGLGHYCQLGSEFSVWFSGVASNWYGLLAREPI